MSLLILALGLAVAAPGDTLPALELSAGLEGWRLAPGDASMVKVENGAATLTAPQANCGVETRPLVLGQDLKAAQVYEISANVQNHGVQQGTFGFSVCCNDARGARLTQFSGFSLSPGSRQSAGRRRIKIGPGTTNAYPQGTHHVVIRFSFHDIGGKPAGSVTFSDVAITESRSETVNGWPPSIVVNCGEIQTRLESRSFWTLYRLDYQGVRLGKDQFGSHWGSVANFPGTGFIGSGHTENEDEVVRDVQLFADGKKLDPPPPELTASELVLTKRSQLRSIELNSKITVTSDWIDEEVTVQTSQPVELNVFYHFMHPWLPVMSDYLAVLPDGKQVSGKFVDDSGMRISSPVAWSAVYSDELQKGALTVVLAVPTNQPWDTRYWDKPEVYRKHYFATFEKALMPANQAFYYKVRSAPFSATPETWQATATRLADKMR